MSVTGQNIPHESAVGHVSGRALYIEDRPPMHRELVAGFLGSPLAKGRIERLDLSAAQHIPGVVGLYTWRDLAHNRLGPIIVDEPLLAEKEVSFIGQPVVVIAAENRAALTAAREAIILQIKEEEPILSIARAREAESFIGHTRIMERGDWESALAGAEHVLEGVFSCGGQDHFYLESQAVQVIPGEDSSLEVYSSTQHPTEVQNDVAHLLGLSSHQVVCHTRRMGGAFGGKESQATHPAVMTALVALRTGRPARMIYTKDEDMVATGKRHPFENHYRVGFDRTGRLLGLEVHLYSDGGAYADLSTAVMSRAMCHVDNAYYLPAVRVSGTICRTNFPPNTAFRGFGGPQGVATIESILEDIAQFLGEDALTVRRLNCYGEAPRNCTPYGQIVANNLLPELFDRLSQDSEYKQRRQEIQQFNQQSRTHLRGLAITAVKFGISFNTKFLNQASALVNIYLDGTVQVSTGATEMGQGVHTKIRQIVADALGQPVEKVRVMETSTEKSNNASATAASSGADLNGSAAANACSRLRTRLAAVAAEHLSSEGKGEVVPEDIVFADGMVFPNHATQQILPFKDLVGLAYRSRVSMGERGFYATPNLSFDPRTHTGSPFLYFTNGCAVAEVRIDRFTGELKVLRADLLMDIGKSINPGIDRGQITGGFIQGMGWVTTEELVYSPKGELWSHSPTTYKIPNVTDVPEDFRVDWVENPHNTVNLRGSKAVGEPPLMLGIAVWAAVKDALGTLAPGQPVPLRVPATGEEILRHLTRLSGQRKNDLSFSSSTTGEMPLSN